MMGISKSSVYRIFFHHVSVPEGFYLLCPVISVDEFRATTDKGTYAFHITDPVSSETIDIIEDRKASILRNYFTRCPLKEKNRVRIIIMDLSNPFRSIMHNLFPHATIIADRFHYVRVFGDGLRRSMIDTCSTMKNKKLARSIKRNPHLFDKYKKDLNDPVEWYDRHLKKYFTCRSYVEYVFEQEETDSFYESYQIYQGLLKLIH